MFEWNEILQCYKSLCSRRYLFNIEFDMQVSIPEHKLQLWPGYYTSMRQHEKNLLLNCDMKFKFMRIDNVYDMLIECQSANVCQEFQSKIIGNIVLTSYNNKTYRIDDVDFKSTPSSTFSRRDGSEISYIDYYKERYNVRIQVEFDYINGKKNSFSSLYSIFRFLTNLCWFLEVNRVK